MTRSPHACARSAIVAAAIALLLAGCGDTPEQQIASAKSELARKDYKSAVIRLKGVLQKDANIAEARFLLGKAALESDDSASAEKELRKAAELGFPQEAVAPLLSRAMIELGEHKKVLEQFGNVSLSAPEAKAELLVNVGYAHLAARDVEAARKAVAEALAAKPDHARAILANAWLKAAADKDVDSASALVDGVVAKDPDSLEALGMQSSLARAKGDSAKAIKAYQRIAQLRPTRADAHFAAATLLLREGKKQEANAQVDAMKKGAPGHPLTSYLQALIAFNDKNLPAARDQVAQTLKSAPQYVPALLLSGMVNAQLGQYELAELHLGNVLSANPKSLAARRALIGVMVRTGRQDKALEMAQTLLKQAPENPEVLKVAAATYMQAGDAKKAEALFEKAAALTPKDARTRTGLALARFATGEADDAIKDLEAASAADDTRVEADVLLVNQYLAKKQFDKALDAVKAIERKRPDNPATQNLKGMVLLAAKRLPEARESFEKALQLKADFLPALLNLTRIDLAEKKPDAAKKRFEETLAKQPKNVLVLIAYADLLRSTKASSEEVRKILERAVEADPKDAGARTALAAFHIQNKDLNKALTVAQEANAAIPGNVRLLGLLGELQLATGASDQAVTTFTRAVALAPESTDLLIRLADAQVAQNSTEAALQSLRAAIKLKPNLPAASARIAAIELKGGHATEAVKAARELQKQKGSESIGYLLEGNIHTREKKWNEAATAYRNGLEKSKSPLLAVRLHASLMQAGKKQEADKVVADWLKANPKDGFLRNYLGERALAEKNYDEAIRQYKAVLEHYPNHALVLNNLAWAASQVSDPKAIEYAEQANKAAPNIPSIMDTLGWILVEKGETQRGIELLQQALAKAPGAAGIRLNLAKALVKTGRKDEARKELDTLAKLGDKYPNQAEVAKLLKEL